MGSVRGHVGTQGPAPLTAQRQEFGRLIAKGVNNSEACQLIGVNRAYGTRWRFGRTVTSGTGFEPHYAPVAMTNTKSLSARFLSEDERVLIGDRFRAGVSLRAIGPELGRLVRPKERRLAGDPVLRGKVQGWLDQRWSPEQIVHTLRLEHPDRSDWHLVHESIYQAI